MKRLILLSVFGVIIFLIFVVIKNEQNSTLVQQNADGAIEIACEPIASNYNPDNFTTVIQGEVFTETLVLEGEQWNNTLIEDCSFPDIDGEGILLRDVENVVIHDCTFENINGQAAIRGSITGGTKGVIIDGNDISSTTENGITFGQRAADGVDHQNLVIKNNLISNTGLEESGGKSHAIYVQAQDVQVLNNSIQGIRDGNGISIRSSGVVKCNKITGISKTTKPGIRYYSDHQRGATNRLLIKNNQVLGEGIGINLFKPVARYDGLSTMAHVVESFKIIENDALIEIDNRYLSEGFSVELE